MPGFEETENEIRYRVKEPSAFQEDSFRRKELEGVSGVSIVIAKPKSSDKTEVQAYRFDKDTWTMEKAKEWIAEHKPQANKEELTSIIVCKTEEIDVDKPIHLIPIGYHKTEKGDFTLDDIPAIIAKFENSKNDMVIDYEHQTLHGNEAPAAGWIKRLFAKEDGLWGDVEWTEKARNYIKNKEYRYLSPVFAIDATRKVIKLINAGLTNQPAIDGMQPLVNKENLNIEEGQDMFNEKQSKELLQLLACKEDSTVETVFDAIKKLKEKAEVIANKAVTTALGVSETARESEIVGTIMAMKQGSDSATDMAARLAAMETAMKKRNAEEAIELAMKQGKITPAQKEWAESYATADLEGFKVFAAKAPVVVPIGNFVPTGKGNNGNAVDDSQLMINKMLGIDTELFKKHNVKEEG